MKRSLIEILVCPICKGLLQLTVEEENDVEVLEGKLYCSNCGHIYFVNEGMPNLLPPELNY